MNWQKQNKLFLFSFLFLATALVFSAGESIFQFNRSSNQIQSGLFHNAYFNEASTISFPDYINQFIEVVESKENKEEQEGEYERISSHLEVSSSVSSRHLFFDTLRNFEFPFPFFNKPRLFILLHELKIFY